MICVILLITAHSITARGERSSSTFRHLAAWLQLTGWCLSCRPSSAPCWSSKHGTASQTFSPLHVRGSFRNKDSALIRLFIQKFRKKKIQEILRYTFRDGVRKIRHGPSIGGKIFEASDIELENKQKTIK